jgi:hypothetical protein
VRTGRASVFLVVQDNLFLVSRYNINIIIPGKVSARVFAVVLGSLKQCRGSFREPSPPANACSPHEPGLVPRLQHGWTTFGLVGSHGTFSDRCCSQHWGIGAGNVHAPVTMIESLIRKNSSTCWLTLSMSSTALVALVLSQSPSR